MRRIQMAVLLAAGLGISGCAGMNDTQQRTATGALGGGAVGGIIGSFTGNAGLGALLGAGVGGAGGYLYDQSQQQSGYNNRGYNNNNRGYNNNRGNGWGQQQRY
ncbi:glycine zipper domain-containing protein [Sediminicoccus sp. KRV36]|uniref:glycine zipper domain-containing protein n=1 Tax=Sediminicoccus sp. KRV36 TaxID=3133721 RepID=UPI00200BA52E|nr:glycine zipper domain-containing protein [Sediminicoccus rosea]UPY35404.1 hypothetical protein LHU95_14375 [Sediminicoccus rosea]